MNELNWAGTYAYRARALHRPSSVDELQEIVAQAPQIGVLGSRHSFNGMGDAEELVTLDGLPPDIDIDRPTGTVSCSAALRYAEIAQALECEGLALHNLASLPHISVAGAVATATHGSGEAAGNLATAVAGLELVTSAGELVTAARGEPGFDGMVVSLGALGAVTRVTLDVEPAYEVRQRVFERLSWEALFDDFDAVASAGCSVSVFSRYGDATEQVGSRAVWTASRSTFAPTCSARERRSRTSIPSPAWIRCTPRRSSASPARGGTGCRTSACTSGCPTSALSTSKFYLHRGA